MSEPEDLFFEPLEINEEALRTVRRGTLLSLTDELRVLARKNFLRLQKRRAWREDGPPGQWRAICQMDLHSTPAADCRFVSVALDVKVKLTPRATIARAIPTVGGKQEVKFSEQRTSAVEFSVEGVPVKPSLSQEYGREYTVEYPTVTGSWDGNEANWVFSAPTKNHVLTLEHPLELVVNFPRAIDHLRATVEVMAEVEIKGWKGAIPLIGRKQAGQEAVTYLDK